MAIDATDWTIGGTGNLDIRYTGDDHNGASPTYATVLEFHRWLQDLADDAVASQASSDLLDITDETPSERATDNIITLLNGYNIDDTAAEHLYDGSVTQGSGATETRYSGLVVLGSVEAGTQLQIFQDGSLRTTGHPVGDDFWNTNMPTAQLNADAANNIIARFMVKTREFGATIDGGRIIVAAREWGDTYAEFSVTLGTGNSVAAISTSADLNNQNSTGDVGGWTHTNTEGYQAIDISGDGTNEYYYSKWNWVSGGTGSNNAANDLYEWAKYIQRRGSTSSIHGFTSDGAEFRGITHKVTYDADTGNFTENNDLVWGTNVAWDTPLTSAGTVGEYYEFSDDGYTTIKARGQLLAIDDDTTAGNSIFAIQSGGSALADGDTFRRADGTANDGATINVTILNDNNAGAWPGGKGRILAENSSNGDIAVWIQLLKGQAPVDNIPLWDATTAGVYDNDAGATALANVAATQVTVNPVFIGSSTGSALIGSVGIGVDTNDTTDADTFFDLETPGTPVNPPNNIKFTVTGLVSTEDRVLVGPENAGALHVSQMALQTTLSTDNITSVVTTGTAPVNTPAAGTLRVVDDNGVHRRLEYSGFTEGANTTWTITTTDGNEDFASVNATAANDVYVTYIDELADNSGVSGGINDTGSQIELTFVYEADDTFFVRVRDGASASPIKTFETTSPVTSGGGSATAIRNPDA